ncbi:MAG: N-carbamoylputrescine amidase [Alphaproteobacteria bacterium]|nr:N-carbamoylputrescine amidase [Rhizobiaceae bacterium]MBU3962026.1 N-carbamoylputrescine amidase [Alphaproteobacteria bacterium]MBU4048095.1 N-carbamoylputrescine amidase [Alphaproteobacteria bacterium]MBU4091413.1 N-carbamoylputrescine amidase [Alphaproteobacteria bacterium]MBU4159030.1 N-carbamoylputrescine amidase [Alphaproteobacteria bacterium]
MRTVTVAATQMACTWDIPGNIARAENLIRKAAAKGAQIVLIQELFEAPYFCQDQIGEFFDMAKPFENNPLIAHFSRLAAELDVVLPVSFFEKAGQTYFNSVAIVDADGTVLGLYRKSHIPDGPGYTEKYYFSPGDTGFRVWQTKHARIGVGICWDQWFPEAARAMALQGAELLFYPTAIGSEPQDPTIDSAAHWQRVMQGHAAANIMPVIASNRIGTEPGRKGTELTFYGSSFIADQTGNKVAEADRTSEAILTATFDLDGIARQRSNWGLFRDRRPELYTPLLTMDGRV